MTRARFALGVRTRAFAFVFASLSTAGIASFPTTAHAETAQLAEGRKAARSKDWSAALSAFEAANAAQPSAEALEGVANARYQLKHDAEAYAAYDEYVKKYGDKAPKASKSLAETRLKELDGKTGQVAISVTEAGAAIAVDDKPVGTSPLASPLRLSAGPHRIRVTKDGFAPFDTAPSVLAGTTTNVSAKLEASSTKGHLSVREKSGNPVRVVVDGVDMGDAPWSGDVEAGTHDVVGKGASFASAPQKVAVERGKNVDVELEASSTLGTLKIATSDGKGIVYLDGKVVAEGTFEGQVPSGTHVIRVTRDGYDPYEESIDLKEKENKAVSVTLSLNGAIHTGEVVDEGRRLEGMYGGLGLLMTFLPGGSKSSMQKLCDASDHPAELTSCDGGSSLGGGLTGFIGYHWDPVGVELAFGGQYDQTSSKLDYAASSLDPGIGPDPARTEEFSVRRFGGYGAARIRLTLQSQKVRFTVAGGVGLSFRWLSLDRSTTGTGAVPGRDRYLPDVQAYVSPVVMLEPMIMYRVSDTFAIGAGLTLLLENPSAFDAVPTTPSDGSRKLGPSGLSTPSYQLASDTQFFIGPTLGVMFGP